MNEELKNPDFERLVQAVNYEEPDYLPLIELWIDPPVKAAFLGDVSEDKLDCRKPGFDLQKDIEFWYRAGYDYIRLSPQYEFPKPWLNHPEARLTTLTEFEKYPWPSMDDIDFSSIENAVKHLPEGMRVIAAPQGGIYEEAWLTMGNEAFMLNLYQAPELIQKVCDKIGETLLKMFQRFAQYNHIGALWLSDDIAYTEALIMSPKTIRTYLIPWYERFAAVAHKYGKLFFFHSDGDLTPLLDDFIAIGFDAIHPIEPKAMDVLELKKRVQGKLGLLGSVDLDYPLSRGKPKGVERYVKQRIKLAAPGSGFAIGSSNSITHYVPLENYQALLDTVKKYGQYPIRIT